MNHKKDKVLKYEFVLFKLEGHETWRFNQKANFDHDLKKGYLKVTATKTHELNRITGVLKKTSPKTN